MKNDSSPSSTSQARKPSQATQLVNGALKRVDLWHTPDGEPFATIKITVDADQWEEHWPLRSRRFREWLSQQFFLGTKPRQAPSAQALTSAINILSGYAYESPEYSVFTRIGRLGDELAIYLDLGTRQWEVIEITKLGWRLMKKCPVKFRRSRTMLPLPYPERGDVNQLEQFVNLGGGDDWILFLSFLIGAFRPRGPYPILVLSGEYGSGKSTLAKISQRLIDPHKAAARKTPHDTRDLMIAATNSWLLAYDNLSYLPDWLSDDLCRLSTGGGLSTRELYTDAEEITFDAQRPVILNGIEAFVTRGDLMDRSIILYLPPLRNGYRTEAEFWASFSQAAPGILGALLDAVVEALRNVHKVSENNLPRMADFATWNIAAEQAMGFPEGAFIEAYRRKRADTNPQLLEMSLVGQEMMKLGEFQGTAQELLDKLNRGAEWNSSEIQKSRDWPKAPNILSNHLRRIVPVLRNMGVEVDFSRAAGKSNRIITIKKVSENTDAST